MKPTILTVSASYSVNYTDLQNQKHTEYILCIYTTFCTNCCTKPYSGMEREIYLHISRCQLTVPDEHDSDDVQGGLIQTLAQHLDQLVRDLWT